MRIAVIGAGHVGLSLAVMLARRHGVVLADIDRQKVNAVNARVSPVSEADLSDALACPALDLVATTDVAAAASDADCVVIATPTDYEPTGHCLDTSIVDGVALTVAAANQEASVVVRSTVPIGHTARLRDAGVTHALFSPEFLREGHALSDSLSPSRVIVGADLDDADLVRRAESFAALLVEVAAKADVPTLVMGDAEAEAVKLFSNSYLALRVSYFNELDSLAEAHGLDVARVIEGMSLDPRIGRHYNNPSFGYGGPCLPKDTRQLLAHYEGIPQSLATAVVEANLARRDFVVEAIVRRVRQRGDQGDGTDVATCRDGGERGCGRGAPVVGVYRLTAKRGSDDLRSSVMWDIVRGVESRGIPVVVFEPTLDAGDGRGVVVTHDVAAFKRHCDLIVANRWDDELADVADKVYTRDLFHRD